MLIRVNAKTIDLAALLALAALVIAYPIVFNDASSPSAGWAWLGVAVILLGANVARLNVGARPSERGVAVGVAALGLALLRITGIVGEVTLPIATAVVLIPLLLVWISRRRSAPRRRS
ncbi:MAG: hypothetical protein ACKODF_04245 [Candidatus Limnocylindrus sp.]